MEQQTYIAWRNAKIKMLLEKQSYDMNDLVDIVTILRGEGGCPWDREQDHHSIRKGLIEECYEVVEAIDREDPVLLREELGDVLLQVVFHADMEKDAGRFTLTDVANDECVKMIHRHPHVFGQVKADTSAQVLANWEVIKTAEKKRDTLADQLRSIPPMLPALMRAQKVGKKTDAGAGLSEEQLIAEAMAKLEAVKTAADATCCRAVLGETLFALTTLCRRLGVEAEEALTETTEQVIASVEP